MKNVRILCGNGIFHVPFGADFPKYTEKDVEVVTDCERDATRLGRNR